MDIVKYNRAAWNKQAKAGGRWSVVVSSEEIDRVRNGDLKIILTPNKVVPLNWFGELKGKKVLCLASGGGQQAPLLAAAGADVTSFDNSDEQLALDNLVAERDSLSLKTVQGDMADLSIFDDESFDLIFHPVSNVFVEDVLPVWKECFRVLKWSGRLLSGFMNPSFFLFDHFQKSESETLKVKHSIPYSDLISLSVEQKQQLMADGEALEFGHGLQEQIGGQTKAGFVITDLYEDDWDDEASPLNKYTNTSISTLARKVQID